ncbi:MAG: hypothetical protein XXXJIFNMEKO3_02529 [Candidatus Erwinia impunctatus]|nr:hypothetical protein XXXJIFNMEKO_02529 [Culicoides impunctatus]
MSHIIHHLHTGGDPRHFADYGALRDELAKLTHPARPDINWQHAEQLCLNLFEQNGIDLQTAAWYTEARARRCGLNGLNEGLSIIDALIRHQWSSLWPLPVHHRMDILSGLNKRVQQLLRKIVFDYRDLPAIYKTEQVIISICQFLERLELKHASQLGDIGQFMHQTALRLEKSQNISPINAEQPSLSAAPQLSPQAGSTEATATIWEYHAQQSPQVVVASPVNLRKKWQWKGFISGVICTLLLAGITSYTLRHFLPASVPEQIKTTLPYFPAQWSQAEQTTFRERHASALDKNSPELLTEISQQLNQMTGLPLLWRFDAGGKIIQQAHTLWPGNEKVNQLEKKWRENTLANAASDETLIGWADAERQLQDLANKLNGLDEKRGHYLTVSQLKSAIFSIQQTMNRNIPVEETLRQLAERQRLQQNIPEQLTTRLDNHLIQLLNRYALISQMSAEHTAQ